MSIKPIKVWGKGGPNPPKVPMVLEELGVPYEFVPIEYAHLKNPEYTAINPNGRIPSIHDPNTDLTLWESGAIVEYLVERYDKDHKISFTPGTNESYLAKQFLFYQVSGQGPYYGQAVWFKIYHQEKLPSALERYINEAKRVTGVLEGHLKRQKVEGGDGPWLVGSRFSFADFVFVPWQVIITMAMGDEGFNPDEFPTVKDWVDRISKRPAIAKVLEGMHKAMK